MTLSVWGPCPAPGCCRATEGQDASNRSATNPEPTERPPLSGCCPRWASRCGASPPGSHAPATARRCSAGSRRWPASDGPHCAGGCGPRLSGARSPATPHQGRHARCQLADAAGLFSWSVRQRDPADHRTWASWRTGWPGPGEAGQSDPCRPCRVRTSREPAVTSMSRHSRATVSPTRSPDRHMMSAATRARRSPRSASESRSRSTCWGFQ